MSVCLCLFEVEVSVFVCLFVSIKSYVFLSILFEVCICVYMCLVCVYVFPRVFAESLACMKLFLFIFDCKKKTGFMYLFQYLLKHPSNLYRFSVRLISIHFRPLIVCA